MRRLITILLLVTAALIALLIIPNDYAGKTRIYNSVDIDRPADQVFDYVTTPANWPRWHPSSLGVSAGADHTLKVGEQVTEDFDVAGHKGRALWTVAERDAPRRWAIDGKVEGGGSGHVTYTLTGNGDKTRFEREFVYPRPNLLFALLDEITIRRRIEAESAEAVRRLKFELEKG
jgi:uncharacterized protein YndB with AHSA1/START domain